MLHFSVAASMLACFAGYYARKCTIAGLLANVLLAVHGGVHKMGEQHRPQLLMEHPKQTCGGKSQLAGIFITGVVLAVLCLCDAKRLSHDAA